MLNNASSDIHILALSETKLESMHLDNYFCIDKYQLFRRDRIISEEWGEQGGVSLFM